MPTLKKLVPSIVMKETFEIISWLNTYFVQLKLDALNQIYSWKSVIICNYYYFRQFLGIKETLEIDVLLQNVWSDKRSLIDGGKEHVFS